MPALLLSKKNGDLILSANLAGRRKLTIGRSRKCDLALKGADAARHDAVLFDAGGDWMMTSTGSVEGFETSTGTHRCITFDGPDAWVRIGRVYAWIDGAPPTTMKINLPLLPPAELGVALRAEFAEAFTAEMTGESGVIADYGWNPRASEVANGSGAGASGVRLVVADAAGDPIRRVPLSGLEKFCIGRSTRCDLIINHPTVSRVHCLLYLERDRWYVADCESSSGTRVDGTRVGRRRLGESSILEAGDVMLWVEGLSETQPGATATHGLSEGLPGDTGEFDAEPLTPGPAAPPTSEDHEPSRLSAFLDDAPVADNDGDVDGGPADGDAHRPSRPGGGGSGGAD